MKPVEWRMARGLLGMAGVALLLTFLGGGTAGPIVAADQPSMTIKFADPAPRVAVAGTMVTWTATVEPHSGTPTDQWLRLEGVPMTECMPSDICTLRYGVPTWKIPLVDHQLTLTATSIAGSTGTASGKPTQQTGTIFIVTDGSGCWACDPMATLYGPTLKSNVKVTTADGGPLLPGMAIHVVTTVTSNVGPIAAHLSAGGAQASMNVALSPGITDVTNVTASSGIAAGSDWGTWWSVWANVDEMGKSFSLSFDGVVDAKVGSDLSLEVGFGSAPWNGTVHHTTTVHVGPPPTQKPQAAATQRPQAPATQKPHSTRGPDSSSPSDSSGPSLGVETSDDPPSPPDGSETLVPVDPISASTPTTDQTDTPAIPTTSGASSLGSGAVVVIFAAAAIIGIGLFALAVALRRTRV